MQYTHTPGGQQQSRLDRPCGQDRNHSSPSTHDPNSRKITFLCKVSTKKTIIHQRICACQPIGCSFVQLTVITAALLKAPRMPPIATLCYRSVVCPSVCYTRVR